MLFLFHLSVVVLNLFTLWYDQQYVDLPFPNEKYAAMPFKARPLFLTVWCFILQTAYFTIALLNDIFGTNATAPKKTPLIRKIKDFVFSIAFTIGVYVSLAFWGLYYVNKDLIMPDEIEKKMPSWLNHTMHTFIVLFIIIELFVSKRKYPSRSLGISVALLINFVYVIFIHALYFYAGMWLYPFLNVFSWPMKFLYFICSGTIGISIYVLGENLNRHLSLDVKVMYKNGVEKLQ